MRNIRLFFLFLFLNGTSLEATDCHSCSKEYVHQLFIGPELYHLVRTRQGGTRQSGGVYGVRLGYERVKERAFYVGLDFFDGKGHLSGYTGQENPIRSRFFDMNAEARLGYMFAKKTDPYITFTPFLIYGYGREKNNFIHPSRLFLHFRLRYEYAGWGFQAKIKSTACWDAGINFKMKYLINPKNRVSNDPDFAPFNMSVNNEWQYRLEIPLTYYWKPYFLVQFLPIYEYRHYGGHQSYPFDFLETRLRIFGGSVRLIYAL
jgi:hypothetical protein